MENLWQDIKLGWRMLARSPGFTAVVIAILAVGIGANTAIFSVVNAVMLRPLPYEDADRLVFLFESTEWGNQPPLRARFLLCRQQNQVFDHVAGSEGQRPYVTDIDNPRQVRAAVVSPGYFPLLGIQPVLGRGFRPDEELPGNEHVVIISHAFWQNDLGGASNVIGKTITVDEDSHAIIGVLPPEFEPILGTSATALYRPLVVEKIEPFLSVFTVARLKGGVTLEQARAAMAVTAEQIKKADAEADADHALVLQRPLDRFLEGKRKLPLLLLGAAGLVLLIACSNVANLFLARAVVRQREMAMRAALGASRRRILQQMLTESLMLSGAGGALGLLMALCTIGGLIRLCPVRLPRLEETSMDHSVLAFTLGLSVLTGLLFGTMPAWKASGVHQTRILQEGAARSTTGRRARCLHGTLVVVQMGLSLILLVGAALVIRSLMALHRLDLGFRPRNVLAVTVSLPEVKYPDPQRCQAFFESLLARVQTLPQVRTAGLSSGELGLGFGGAGAVSVSVPERLPSTEKENPALFSSVTPGFLETLGVRLLRGRTLTNRDGVGQNDSIVIDERLARRYFGDRDPVGQQLDFPDSRHTVVGVTETVKDYENLDQTWGAVYAPISGIWWFPDMVLVVRTDGDPVQVTAAIRAQAAALEKDEVVRRVETVEAKLSGMLAPRRFSMILLSLFAAIALILATVGVYGLLSYSTIQQTRDIGIRMALGAERADVRRMVLSQGLTLILIGVGVGLAGAVALTRVLSSLLYDVTPTDPVTLVLVSGVLMAVALLASYLPARRAARIDPMEALRYE